MSVDEELLDELNRRIAEIYESRGIPTQWDDVTPEPMRPAFSVHFRALPSPQSGYPGWDEAELLIHDPLTALRNAGLIPDGETPDISTFVVNHQHTLNRMVMYATVTISNNPHTVGITIVKEPLPAELQELLDGATQGA